MKKKNEDRSGIIHKQDPTISTGNKVLPINEFAQSLSITNNDQCPRVERKDSAEGDKRRAVSRMKELMRWAATAAKLEKGGYIGRKVMQLRNRSTLKALPNDDQFSNDSPKINFRWDAESCSTISSISAISIASSLKHEMATNAPLMNSTPLRIRDHECVGTIGSWITTDSEFVVLEL